MKPIRVLEVVAWSLGECLRTRHRATLRYPNMDHDETEDYDDIVARLHTIAEELTDRGMDLLRRSIEDDGNTYDDEQKRIGKARRAIEKAAHILGGDQLSPW